MSPLLGVASTLITLALAFYTLGVWAERIARYLKPWHLAAFWLGLVFDAAGTYAMDLLNGPGVDWTSVHTWTGQLAIGLMFTHAVWATTVVRRNDECVRATFHRFSLLVWGLWLVPYVGGAIAGMTGAKTPF
ncbi:MAG: TIGR03987 family protein [Coriobacteriaceae bacterium]|nr:TIGR03987 family protein [Coriobacteriaceae bacterium]